MKDRTAIQCDLSPELFKRFAALRQRLGMGNRALLERILIETNQSHPNVGMTLARAAQLQNCTWRCPMKKLYERLLYRLGERLRGPWPDAVPLPPHVANLKLNPELLLIHLIKTTNETGR